MVAGGHDVGEKRLTEGGVTIELTQGVFEKRLVRYAPDIFKGDALGGKVGTIDHAVAIATEIGIHVVEIAVTAVDEIRFDPLLRQYAAEGDQVDRKSTRLNSSH